MHIVTMFYKEMGWDPQLGCPTRETLQRLGLEDRRTLGHFVAAEQMVVRRDTPLTILSLEARRNGSEVIQQFG